MSVYVYPTDENWFRFLRQRSRLDEVNFWQPGGTSVFRALQPGDLFLFRLKSPINKIAGGGIFEHASLFPFDAAWDAFGEKNGMPTYAAFWQAIADYRSKNGSDPLRADSPVGCIILRSPFFLPEDQWIPVPADYHLSLVQGKRFPLDSETGKFLFAWGQQCLTAEPLVRGAIAERALTVPGEVYGEPGLVRRRLGQGAFRVLVTDAYYRRCAVTGEKTLPVLEAAHIKPVSRGGEHRLDNGLLLRSDIHTLFDLGYVTVTPENEFRVSQKLKETWMNGRVYYDLDRKPVQMPDADLARPSKLLLEWHNDTVFRT